MDKTGKFKKYNGAKRLEHLLKHQELFQIAKTYNPGKVDFINTPKCEARVVNFFGDVHTEVFALKVSSDDQKVIAGCSNG